MFGSFAVKRLSVLAVASVLSATGLAVARAPEAGAIAVPTFSLTPIAAPGSVAPRGSFHYDMLPGQTINDSVILTNETSQLQDFQIWATDGLNTPVGGAFALRPLGYPMTGVGTWVNTHLGSGVYGLNGNTSVTINFSVTAPANATPGDHAGGIEALNVTPVPQPTNGPAHFIIHRGVATAMFIRVAGPARPGAAVSNISAKSSVPAIGFGSRSAVVSYQLENTGNTLLSGQAVATVTDIFGRTVKTFAPVGVQDFVPGARFTVIEPRWNNLPLFGPETVHVKFIAPGMPTVNGSSTFWIFPWLLVLLVLAVLGFIGWLLWTRRQNRANATGQSGEGDGSPPDGETAAAGTAGGAAAEQVSEASVPAGS